MYVVQAFFCAHPKKNQGRQNSRNWKLKEKTQAQRKNSFPAFSISDVRHFPGFHQIFARFQTNQISRNKEVSLLRLFFAQFSGKRRVADLPENWGFCRFSNDFLVNSWVFEKFCMILEKNHYILTWASYVSKIIAGILSFWHKILEFSLFWAWVLVFTPWVLELTSKKSQLQLL